MSVAPKLLAAPATVAAREALAAREDAWIVGGAVRDAIAGKEVTDLDLAVADGEADASRRIAAASGGRARGRAARPLRGRRRRRRAVAARGLRAKLR